VLHRLRLIGLKQASSTPGSKTSLFTSSSTSLLANLSANLSTKQEKQSANQFAPLAFCCAALSLTTLSLMMSAHLQADSSSLSNVTNSHVMSDHMIVDHVAVDQVVSDKDKLIVRHTPNLNTNLFLLSSRVNNESRLAQLQMQPVFPEFDAKLFSSDNQEAKATRYAGVGFPHIETAARPYAEQYKPYRRLVSFSSDENGQIVPQIQCMGLKPQRVAKRAAKYETRIINLAIKHNVSASLVKAVVAKESCFNTAARSHVGAIGLMQLMPETAQWLNVRQPENADQNLAAGVRYLAQLRKRFGSDELALAAYNAGPGNVERYNGIPPFAETQAYVRDVMYFYRGYVATTRFVNAMNDYN